MPNWCNNTLQITGPNLQEFKVKATGHSAWDSDAKSILNFHSLYPIPPEVIKAGYEEAGYEWERNNWGCKWGASNPELTNETDGCLVYQFDTAWSPPIEFLSHIAKLWPHLIFVLEYEECGIGFKGIAKLQGDKLEDYCVSL
jgi:hypothetical protein